MSVTAIPTGKSPEQLRAGGYRLAGVSDVDGPGASFLVECGVPLYTGSVAGTLWAHSWMLDLVGDLGLSVVAGPGAVCSTRFIAEAVRSAAADPDPSGRARELVAVYLLAGADELERVLFGAERPAAPPARAPERRRGGRRRRLL